VGPALSRRRAQSAGGGAELLTFFTFPNAQWKTLRTTNVIERLNEEFRAGSWGRALAARVGHCSGC